jgi:hypothetical protein
VLFLVIERFKGGDPRPVYQRFRESGRMTPGGVSYVASWVTTDLSCCYQVMECDSRAALDEWIARWSDLVDFEIMPVITSADAASRVS